MDERLRFVARRLDGEKMDALCEEFGISRKTGYKIFERYKDCGIEGLTDSGSTGSTTCPAGDTSPDAPVRVFHEAVREARVFATVTDVWAPLAPRPTS